MRISYRPLWVILAEREMTKKELREKSGISTASLAKLGKGENLTTDVLLKICETLNCNINEIVETVSNENEEKKEKAEEEKQNINRH
ncbi:MAG: helix-turn-helix transcriptional regulator [Oscillospiraceae bacterium]|nr:helix-turn-helix transcriptional regulator [Oscillospiraceae bacterium]